VVSHSYTLYGPLLVGAATVLYEGKPVGTPDASAFWRLVSEYKVNTMFTAPTALRAIRKDDPANTAISRIGGQGGLRSLKALFVAGERSEPALITMYQDLLKRYAADDARVIDNWWSSESGSPITAIALAPSVARLDPRPGTGQLGGPSARLPAVKPGSAGKPMPGFDVRIVNDAGDEVKRGKMGNAVLALPLPPTAFCTLWDDEERFYASYLRRFGGRWLDTGDAGMIDSDGYVSIMARSDDIINVAAHRLSTGSLEQAVTSHPLVTEATVVGIPDDLKGQMPFAFVSVSADADRDMLFAEVQELVRSQVGPIASLGGMIVGKGSMLPFTRNCRSPSVWLTEKRHSDPKDSLGQDLATSTPCAGRECSSWRLRPGSQRSIYRRGYRCGRGGERRGQALFPTKRGQAQIHRSQSQSQALRQDSHHRRGWRIKVNDTLSSYHH
jgi:propionyl-CoA synthetase